MRAMPQSEEIGKQLEEMTFDSTTGSTAGDGNELVVKEEHTANIMAHLIGSRMQKLMKDLMTKLLHLEERLHEKAIGKVRRWYWDCGGLSS